MLRILMQEGTESSVMDVDSLRNFLINEQRMSADVSSFQTRYCINAPVILGRNRNILC